ncbi:cobalamin-binding protein [Streptomyces sp. SID14478]|uniref:cobalamin B12-binding domain-containing protein n=1 Tax=Streptomyces sp. SID14478 TaxID=2706073 RepID=UPI0013DED4C3|nr:cobalamin B12-binding domain-containing protein [Streptomyces sp. SID14478]NEB81901.1 cobalamin-binding protein [Streptomyces sp. SID14478]
MSNNTLVDEGKPTLDELRERLWQPVIDGDAVRALSLVRAACAPDTREPGRLRDIAERVLLDVIAPTQERVGVEWAANTITVAQEHAATAVNERCVSALADTCADALPATSRGRVLVACVDGEWHALPARLVAEVLRLRGWHVDYLGAQVPTEHLVSHLHHTGAEAVLLSSSIPTHLPIAHAAISACQAAGVPVLAGGAAFGEGGRYARAMKAKWAPDAPGAAEALDEGLGRPSVTAARLPDLDLPHLNDQEYTMVRRTRRQLVKQALADVEEGFPAMRDYSDYQRERTVEDIHHIVAYLATALYVNDVALFTTFMVWTAGILEARGVPRHSLFPALDSLLNQLSDFPRATAVLSGARSALTIPGPGRPA